MADVLQPSDQFLVNRSDNTKTVTAENLMAELLDSDLMVVNRGDQTYTITGEDIRDSIGGKPIYPEADDITSDPAFQGGTGTEVDPYLLQTIMVRPAGSSGNSVEEITIAVPGATEDDLVEWTDNSVGAGNRFAQPTGVVGAAGTWTGRLVYNDTPATTVDGDYTGNLQIGDVYFRWVVEQKVSQFDPITFTPTITGDNKVGDVLTASAGAITGGEAPIEYAFQWKRNGSDIGAATSKTYTLVEDDIGTTISCAVTVAEPDGSNAVTETATYNQIPVPAVAIVTPTIIAPPDGAGIGGDVTYTPKTSPITDVVTVDDPWNVSTGLTLPDWSGIAFGSSYVAVSSNTLNENQVAYSGNGKQWVTTNNQPATAPSPVKWMDVAHGLVNNVDRYVAVGWSGGGMWSGDGENWNLGNTPQSAGTTGGSSWSGVCYGDKFVAVAQNGIYKLMYSQDGETWIGDNSALSDTDGWKDIAYGNGTYVAVSTSAISTNPIRYSTDGGATWLAANQPPLDVNNTWNGVCYGDGKFVAVSGGSASTDQIAYSTDGINWTSVDSPSGEFWNRITYGDGKYVVVGFTGDNRVMFSEDAINWQLGEAPLESWLDVCYGNSEFVAVGASGLNSKAMWSEHGTGLYTSTLTLTNSNTYNAETDANMSTPISQTFSAGQVVTGVLAGSSTASGTVSAVEDRTLSVFALEEIALMNAQAANDNEWAAICNNGTDLYVAVAQGGDDKRAMYSSDGINWTAVTTPSDDSGNQMGWQAVAYGNGRFVAVSYNYSPNVMYSDNGIDWVRSDGGLSPGEEVNTNWCSIAYGAGKFVAVSYSGTNQIMYSSDGETWEYATSGVPAGNNRKWRSITYGNGYFVTVADSSDVTPGDQQILYSSTGINWAPVDAPQTNDWYAITYGGGRFVVVSNGDKVMWSTDPTSQANWNLELASKHNWWASITYGNGYFVAVARQGGEAVMYSTDGSNWVGVQAPEDNGWYGITYGMDKYIAVSRFNDDQVMWSPVFGNPGPLFNPAPASSANDWYKVCYGAALDRWVAVAQTGESMYSSNGVDWLAGDQLSADGQWQNLAYGDGRYIALSKAGANRAMYSTNGINWTPSNASVQNNYQWNCITYGDDKFVAFAQKFGMYSTDGGVTWTVFVGPDDFVYTAIGYGQGIFTVLAQNKETNGCIYSSNGIDWNLANTAEGYWKSIAYSESDNRFVAVSEGSGSGATAILWSDDGQNWIRPLVTGVAGESFDQAYKSVAYGEGHFVAVSWNGSNQVSFSKDGIDWNYGTAVNDGYWYGIGYGQNKFVAVSSQNSDVTMNASANFGGSFVEGMEVVNTVQVTEFAPDANDMVFVGSIPESNPSDAVSSWGQANFWVSTSQDFPDGNRSGANPAIVAGQSPTVSGSDFAYLEPDTLYYSKLRYNGTIDGAQAESEWSDTITFKTAKEVVTVDDIFSTDLYQGTGANQKITNGLDLLSDGGVVWLKATTQNYNNYITNNTNYFLMTNQPNLAQPDVDIPSPYFESFDNDGYTVGSNGSVNYDGVDFVGLSFRKAPGFFDVVEWTGEPGGNAMQIPHNLGTLPGCIIAKNLDTNDSWCVYHKDASIEGNSPSNNYGVLNEADSWIDGGFDLWGPPTTTTFEANNNLGLSREGENYVAYLFAADTPEMIKCGSYVGNGVNPGDNQLISTDFDPAWVLIKSMNEGNWTINAGKFGSQQLAANLNNTFNQNGNIDVNQSGGFSVYKQNTPGDNWSVNENNQTYVYIAIAKGGSTLFFDTEAFKTMTDAEVIARHGVDPYSANLDPFNIRQLTHEPVGVTAGFAEVKGSNKLRPIQELANTVRELERQETITEVKLDVVKERNRILRQYMVEDKIAEAQALIEQWAAEDAANTEETE